MPGFITHLCFGQQAISQINDNKAQNIIRSHPSCYGLGLHGPDIFFYHVPSYVGHEKNIGNIMHSNNVLLFFEELFEARNSIKNPKDRSICDAYIFGFMGHYTLDVWCHPYIYYRSNHFSAVENRGKIFDFGNHVSLETDIDHMVLREYKGLRPTKFDYAKAVRPSLHETEVISLLLYRAINRTYRGENIKLQTIRNTIFNFANLNRAMFDPLGIKKHVVRKTEQLIFGCAVISSMIPSDSKVKFDDPCNRRHRTWHNPWNPDASSNESIFNLMEQANYDFIEKIDLYAKAIHALTDLGEDDYYHYINKLTALLSDLSYCTGLPI